VKTNFHVNLTCFHTKSTRIHTKVWCELNPCFSLMNVDSRQRAEHATLNCSHVNAEGRAGQHAYHMLSLDLSLDCSASLSSAQSLGTTLAVSKSITLAPSFTCCSRHACDLKIFFLLWWRQQYKRRRKSTYSKRVGEKYIT
jgi:hypothetical protein